jgi:hypothetical protein
MSNPAESPRTLVIERVFSHPPEKLWRALTESPLIAQWMMNNDFEPVVGRKFQFRADPMPNWNGIVDCEVVIVDPLKDDNLPRCREAIFRADPRRGGRAFDFRRRGDLRSG